jgi:hypothetical protein
LNAALSGTSVQEQAQAGAMAKALRYCLENRNDKTGFVGQVHPSHRGWFAEYFKIEWELLQTPCTLSSGIFPHKPSLVAESIPPEDRNLWGNLEDMGSADWQSKPWERNGMACIRSGNVALTKSVIAKAIQSAKAGFQTLLFLEHGEQEKDQEMKTGATSIPTTERECVRVQHVITYPHQQLMWTGSCGWSGEWTQDQTGAFQSCEAEGQASKQRSVQGKAVGFNENRVDAWLYASASAPLMKISEAFRELVKVVANTTSPFPAIGQRSICKINKDFLTKAITLSAEPSFMELRYEALV